MPRLIPMRALDTRFRAPALSGPATEEQRRALEAAGFRVVGAVSPRQGAVSQLLLFTCLRAMDATSAMSRTDGSLWVYSLHADNSGMVTWAHATDIALASAILRAESTVLSVSFLRPPVHLDANGLQASELAFSELRGALSTADVDQETAAALEAFLRLGGRFEDFLHALNEKPL